jgi:hypothetical protein
MRHDYHRKETFCFSVEELEDMVIRAEELNIPEWAYEELQDAIRGAKQDGERVYVTYEDGVEDGLAMLGWENMIGSDSFTYWLFKQGQRMAGGVKEWREVR